jgi:hypothetical protein
MLGDLLQAYGLLSRVTPAAQLPWASNYSRPMLALSIKF